ncbi:MAG: Dickkopf N-terminal cysteine-rich domain-containing protein [Pseudomonadota bacterium]
MAAGESSRVRACLFAAAIVTALLQCACMLDIEKGWMPPPDDAGAEGDVDGEGTPLSVVQQVCHISFSAWCAYLNTCCSAEERGHDMLQGLVADVGYDCVNAASSPMFSDCVLQLADAITAGTMIVNDDDVPPCREAVMGITSSCLNYNVFVQSYNLAIDEHCAGALVGMVEEGKACVSNYACAPGLYCDAEGRCATFVEPGGMCIDPVQCGPGSICLTGGFCGPPRTFGDDCDNHGDCAPMLICDENDRLCKPLLETGSSCVDDDMTCTGLCIDGECGDFCSRVF